MTTDDAIRALTPTFTQLLSGRPLQPLGDPRIERRIYPQRIVFAGGQFWLEAIKEERVAMFPMSEILSQWE